MDSGLVGPPGIHAQWPAEEEDSPGPAPVPIPHPTTAEILVPDGPSLSRTAIHTTVQVRLCIEIVTYRTYALGLSVMKEKVFETLFVTVL